jgi:hypothetical protein
VGVDHINLFFPDNPNQFSNAADVEAASHWDSVGFFAQDGKHIPDFQILSLELMGNRQLAFRSAGIEISGQGQYPTLGPVQPGGTNKMQNPHRLLMLAHHFAPRRPIRFAGFPTMTE